jgi:hypothetical protein
MENLLTEANEGNEVSSKLKLQSSFPSLPSVKTPNFPRKRFKNLTQYMSGRPADFAKATTAKERTEGQNNERKIQKL